MGSELSSVDPVGVSEPESEPEPDPELVLVDAGAADVTSVVGTTEAEEDTAMGTIELKTMEAVGSEISLLVTTTEVSCV